MHLIDLTLGEDPVMTANGNFHMLIQMIEQVKSKTSLPVMISPAGLLRLVHTEGELAIARAAGKAGVVFVVSTATSYSFQEIAKAATGPLWFQLYLWRDREVVTSLVTAWKTSVLCWSLLWFQCLI